MNKAKLLERCIIAAVSVSLPIVVANLLASPPPSAHITCDPASGDAPLTIRCAADVANVDDLRWDFGDGSALARGKSVEHVFATEGEYRVVLTAVGGEKQARHEFGVAVLPADDWQPFDVTLTALPRAERVIEEQSFTIDERKSDHPDWTRDDTKAYTLRFEAISGFQIVDASSEIGETTNASHPSWEIVDGGAAIVVSFELTSGPKYDRTDGWLIGELITRQAKVVDRPEIVLAERLTLSRESDLPLATGIPLGTLERLVARDEAGAILGSASPGEALEVRSKGVALRFAERSGSLFVVVEKLS